MEQFLWTIGAAISAAILASAVFSWVQSAQRVVPASEQGLREYIKQLEGERTELKATIAALQADIKFREKERELLREERQDLNYRIALLQQKVEFLERDLQERVARRGGMDVSDSRFNIQGDMVGGDKS